MLCGVRPPPGVGGTVIWPMNNKKSIGNHRRRRHRNKILVGYTRIQVTVVWCPPPPSRVGGASSLGGGGWTCGEGGKIYCMRTQCAHSAQPCPGREGGRRGCRTDMWARTAAAGSVLSLGSAAACAPPEVRRPPRASSQCNAQFHHCLCTQPLRSKWLCPARRTLAARPHV